jgi:hypothetical protein
MHCFAKREAVFLYDLRMLRKNSIQLPYAMRVGQSTKPGDSGGKAACAMETEV